jgi:hypothetical protein
LTIHNPETLVTLDTQDTGRRQKKKKDQKNRKKKNYLNKTQYSKRKKKDEKYGTAKQPGYTQVLVVSLMSVSYSNHFLNSIKSFYYKCTIYIDKVHYKQIYKTVIPLDIFLLSELLS